MELGPNARRVLRSLSSGQPVSFSDPADIEQVKEFLEHGLLEPTEPPAPVKLVGVHRVRVTEEGQKYAEAALDDTQWPQAEEELRNM